MTKTHRFPDGSTIDIDGDLPEQIDDIERDKRMLDGLKEADRKTKDADLPHVTELRKLGMSDNLIVRLGFAVVKKP